MSLFKTILIPIDFTSNTDVAICKALDIMDEQDASIHLLHVCKPSFTDVNLGRSAKTEKEIDAEINIQAWKESIEEYNPLAKVVCWVEQSLSIEQAIVEKSLELSVDLIVIGKTACHSILPVLNTVSPSRISRQTGCAVLTAKPGSLHKDIKHVIVPVNEDVAELKLEVLNELCRRNRIKISLLTYVNDKNVPEEFSATALLQVYQRIRAISIGQLEYAVLHGQNRVKAILQFAERNGGDILLMERFSEMRIGWPAKEIANIISADSRVQVLAV